jgi:type IV pilus assembly protein PilW
MSPAMRALHRQRGFTIVEVMVATVVALFATLAIFQSFAVSEGYRRSATGGGDANFSGAIGTYLIDRDLRMAGYGMNVSTYLGCAVSGTFNGPPVKPINFSLAPVVITAGAGNAPDSVTIVSSGTGMMPGAISLTTAMAAATSDYVVTDAYGVNSGDLLLLAEAGQNCTLAQASNTPTLAGANQNTIKHTSGLYNPAGGAGPNYTGNGVVMDLGQPQNATANRYWIQTTSTQPNFNSLLVDQLIGMQSAQPVAPNIVQLKAQYGKDTDGDGIVDTWNNVTPTTSAGWVQVLAVRIALVARTANPEKPDLTSGNCTTTTTAPKVNWNDGTSLTLDVSASAPSGPSWQCYRYKVFHVTSSLRNQIWTPS